jgi:aminodeoxyfutalosine deaminase
VRLTPDIVRDLGLDEAQKVLDVAKKFADQGVVALNCAGSERAEIEPFGRYFRAARDAGLRSVPHAGEWAGPENVWRSLHAFSPDRIGHGVRAAEDPRLVAHLAEAGIPLEVCPISNVATGVFASLAQHPFPSLREAGVVVTLNSDDPSMFGAWVGDVYRMARDSWSLTDEDLADLARAAVRASFADQDVKNDIEAGVDGWLALA